jgi:hypothetical protein
MSESQPQRLNQLDGMFKRHRGERSAQYLAEERYQTFQHLDIREIVFLAFFVEKKQIGEACNKYDLQAIIKQAANLPDRPFVFYSDWVQFSKHVSKNSKLKKRQVELDLEALAFYASGYMPREQQEGWRQLWQEPLALLRQSTNDHDLPVRLASQPTQHDNQTLKSTASDHDRSLQESIFLVDKSTCETHTRVQTPHLARKRPRTRSESETWGSGSTFSIIDARQSVEENHILQTHQLQSQLGSQRPQGFQPSAQAGLVLTPNLSSQQNVTNGPETIYDFALESFQQNPEARLHLDFWSGSMFPQS